MASKIIHKHSSVITDGIPKLPTKEQLEYGELAINYSASAETITLRNSSDEIVEFKSKEYFENILNENNYVIVTALNNLDDKKQNILIDGETIKTINGKSILGSGNIEIDGVTSNINKISGLLNIKDLNAINHEQLSLEDNQYKTYIITDSNGNYPSPNNSTVYLDNDDNILDLLYRGNGDALKWLLKTKEAYYYYKGAFGVIGEGWYSKNISEYVKLPSVNLQTAEVGDFVTLVKQVFTAEEFYSKFIDFDSIVIPSEERLQLNGFLSSVGIDTNLSDGESIKQLIINGHIYSADKDPQNDGGTTYPLISENGDVVFYTAQITPNTQKVYSGEFWTGNMKGPGIYSYVTTGRPDGSDNDEFYIGYVSPNGAQTLISMKNPSKVFTRPNLNSSWTLGGTQKIINDDLYRTKYGYGNIADSCLKTGVNAYFNDTICGITGNWSLFVTCSYDGDPNYYHLLQTAICRDGDNLGRIFKRFGWYKGEKEDLHFTEWKELCFDVDLSGKQDLLIDGETIKTINGESILGSGNIDVKTDLTDIDNRLDNIDKTIEDNEYVISVVLNKLNNRITDLSNKIDNIYKILETLTNN